MTSKLEYQLAQKLEHRTQRALLRQLPLHSTSLVDFSSNDFLGLSHYSPFHTRFLAELELLKRLGSTGSRLLTGNSTYALELENQIAAFHGAECALLFNSGYDANVGFFSSVPQPNDTVIYDEYIHASVHDGLKTSRAKKKLKFRHNDVADLEKILREVRAQDRDGNLIIAIETLYSMDGDTPPLKEIVEIVEKYCGYLVVDEAHATGVCGERGSGLVCELGLEKRIFARLHTFGKSLASNGAVFLCNEITRSYLINYARSLIYTTFLSFPSLASVKCAYDLLISGDTCHLRQKLQFLIRHFRSTLKLPPHLLLPSTSPIQGIVLPVLPLCSPTVPRGKERVRICLHAHNSQEEIEMLAKAVMEYFAEQAPGLLNDMTIRSTLPTYPEDLSIEFTFSRKRPRNRLFERGLQRIFSFSKVSEARDQEFDALKKKKQNKANTPTDTPPNLKLAFIADQGLGENSRKVLTMIREWGAHAVIHNGDFDYHDSPRKWIQQIDSILGPDFPYFASIGNHDQVKWKGRYGYKHILIDRLYRTKMHRHCRGDYGVNMECNFNGVHFILSGVGIRGTGHADFVDDVFSRSRNTWKICNWHKNQRMFQTGKKHDEVGYEIYEACRRHGAIVATAHEHSYERTHLISNYESQQIASMNGTLHLRPGHSFAFVNGLGGEETRPWQNGMEKKPWWAATASSNNNVDFGAFMCEFHIDGEPNKARCMFRDINRKIWDQFDVYSHPNAPAYNSFQAARTRFLEYPVTSLSDIQAQAALALPSENSRIIPIAGSRNGTYASIVFRNIHLISHERIDHAHLQLLILPWSSHSQMQIKSSAKVRLEIRVSRQITKEDILLSANVIIEEQLEEFETGEIWVSPDIAPLIRPLLLEEGDSKGDITVELRGTLDSDAAEAEIQAYAWGESGCFAPTLTLQTKLA
ncbi:uncharacterized protein VTP21DRAFT_7088 [Calcarisporiella thermophila]|uniref:uncharacterized protein n=1 Tax=Calcarisporiella thermophila TaxID=911321 RepID=UPI003743FE10